MKIASWNVNSLNVRLPHVLQWCASAQPDVLALQETKLEDAKFPATALREVGYEVAFSGQKTYNGVAILARTPLQDVLTDLPGLDDPQRRILVATVGDVRVVNLYVVNGQAVGSEKYAYKLDWLAKVTAFLAEEARRHPRLVVLGDFNIAPEDRDVHDPAAWAGQVLYSDPERQAFRDLLALGFADSFRLFEQPERSYTWWDYRMLAFRRKMGLRIDHILLSGALAPRCTACTIDVEPRRREQPSDHAPVIATLTL